MLLRALKVLMALCLVITCQCAWAFTDDPADDEYVSIAWRSVGSFSNREPFKELKVRSYVSKLDEPHVMDTGQAYQGWHEIHPDPGLVTATIYDKNQAYPVIADRIILKHERCVVFDMAMPFVYEADCLVHASFHEHAGQTFIATGNELAKVTMLVASPFDDFSLTVHKGGPNGPQIGPEARCRSGHSMEWGVARWLPGDVPLEAGQTYYIGIRSRSGKPFAPFCHSAGNVYDGGTAYFDGRPEPISDLGLYITEETDWLTRSIIHDVDEEGWARDVRGVYFTARSSNVRAVFSYLDIPAGPKKIENHFHFYKVESDGDLTPIGPVKHGWEIDHHPDRPHYAGIAYQSDDIPLQIGEKYFLEIVPASEDWGVPDSEIPGRNYNIRIYGEKIAGMTPCIYNQQVINTTSDKIHLSWEGTTPCNTVVLYGDDPYHLDNLVTIPNGAQEVLFKDLQPASTLNFKWVLTTDEGGRFETPVYQARTLDANGQVVASPPLWRAPQGVAVDPPCIGFLNLAKLDFMHQPELPKLDKSKAVKINNPGFDNKLGDWKLTSENGGIGLHDSAAGWDLDFANEEVKDNNVAGTIYQSVKVKPGKTYMLTASLFTYQVGHNPNWYSGPGAQLHASHVRARVVCDPTGGTNFEGNNATQWFRTDGRWLRFGSKWTAESDHINIGVTFSRYRDWNTVIALADDFELFEVD